MDKIIKEIQDYVNHNVMDLSEISVKPVVVEMEIDAIFDVVQQLRGLEEAYVHNCTCFASCGSNFSQNSKCVCNISCGSNYSR